MKKITMLFLNCSFILFSTQVVAVPPVTGDPVIVQHLGKIVWPQDTAIEIPYLTHTNSSDINDLHGDLDCDFIISTAGNYHFALLEAMQGRQDLGFDGLQAKLLHDYNLKACWSTSPPVSVEQTVSEKLQFKNIIMHGKPALAIGPGGVMNRLLKQDSINASTAFLRNKGNVILIRKDKVRKIKDICDLKKPSLRVVTPNDVLESGSFGNFSGTIFNVANQNDYGCDADELFHSIFGQELSTIDLSAFDKPTDIDGVRGVFGRGPDAEEHGPRWVASSRIMHRDIPYALCYDLADAGVIFHHQATYLKQTMAATMNCELEIVSLPGTVDNPRGNRFGILRIAKILGHSNPAVINAQDALFDFFVHSPIWSKILKDNDLVDPSPN